MNGKRGSCFKIMLEITNRLPAFRIKYRVTIYYINHMFAFICAGHYPWDNFFISYT